MQSVTNTLSPGKLTVNQIEAQQSAEAYLLANISPAVVASSPMLIPSRCTQDAPTWRMIVRLRQPLPIATVGVINVNAWTGEVIPLSVEQVEDLRDRIKEQCGQGEGILRPTAQIRANGYLTNHVSLFAQTDRPVFIAGDPPRWRATAFLWLRGRGRVCDLGAIEVNAQSGEVVPLSNKQIQAMRKCAQDAVTRTPLASAPAR